MTRNIVIVLQTMSATCAWACGMFMFRFWQRSRDRLFAFFGVAFWLLSVSWVLLALVNPTAEARPYIYLFRLLAFLLIIVAVVDKNRAGSTSS
jgi:hypothetical protein